ncbi:MAG: M28 family peptidase [bacterium]
MTASKYTDYMYNFIKRVVDTVGPRESGSESEKKCARLLAEEWTPVCDRIDLEPLTCSPTAYLGFFPLLNLLYVLSAAAYWIYPPVSFAIAMAAFIIMFLEFVRYKELLDPLYPKKDTLNVVGTIKPRGEVKRRLVVSGHIDSAYEFNLWLFLKNGATPLMIAAILALLFLVGITFAKTLAMFGGNADAGIYLKLGIAMVALYPIIAPFTFFHTYTAVPGAMDDMAGVSVAAGLGKYLADAKKDGSFFPENTEVLLVGMACEEAGLRGAKRYAAKHLKELKAIPTQIINFDSIYDHDFFTVIGFEVCTTAKHNPKLVNKLLEIARSNGLKAKKGTIPIGATDASAFTQLGLSSTTILCQDNTRLVPNYHTRHDTIEHIRPEALEVCLQVAIDALKKIDAGELG